MPKRKTHEEFIKEVAIKNPNVKVLDKYIADDIKIEFQCNNPDCGYRWFTTPDKIIHKLTGCPECAKLNRAKKRTKTQRKDWRYKIWVFSEAHTLLAQRRD